MSVRILNPLGVLSSDVPVGNLVWVDGVNGVDSLAKRGRMTIPFKTLNAAKAAAKTGDTIMVLPGEYHTNEQLAAAAISWHFLPGAVIVADAPLATALFYVDSDMAFSVSGDGDFDTTSSAAHFLRVTSNGSSSIIKFQVKSPVGGQGRWEWFESGF